MDTILYDLFFGEINPNADPLHPEAAAFEAARARLCGAPQADLLQLLDAHDTLVVDAFVQGFRLGGGLVADVLSTRCTSP